MLYSMLYTIYTTNVLRKLPVTTGNVSFLTNVFHVLRIHASICVCVIFFNDDKAMGTHITLSQLDAAAPVSSYPLGDKPVSQPANPIRPSSDTQSL